MSGLKTPFSGGAFALNYDFVSTQEQLAQLCGLLSSAPWIAFDTEFVSEDTYRPDLCLIQVAGGGRLAIIDPKEGLDVQPFWELLVSGEHETIVHAGREEFRFCHLATGKRPQRLFDVQLAAGLIGLEYPAAYGTLVSRLVGKSVSKGETRTDWRRRPLSPNQLEYALQDVVHLDKIRDRILQRLGDLNRLSWLACEMESWQAELEAAETRERWRRVSGIAGLSPRSLAVVRELWRWREQVAELRNFPPRRILRDDLIVELARRQVADIQRMQTVRGLERGDLRKHLPAIAACIEQALAEEIVLPRSQRKEWPHQLNLLGQFLTTALSSLCRSVELAPALVGTAQDVRDLVAHRLGFWDESVGPPLLAQGWRAEVIGHLIDELLAGNLAIHIHDPLADEPLAISPRNCS